MFENPWPYLGVLSRFCLVLVVLVGIYTAYIALTVVARLRSFRVVADDINVRASLAVLEHRLLNLRQTMVATFYFFGFTFFVQIQGAYFTPDSNRPVGLMVLENFSISFRFAALVFLAFLALHSVQWFVSGQIRRALVWHNKR